MFLKPLMLVTLELSYQIVNFLADAADIVHHFVLATCFLAPGMLVVMPVRLYTSSAVYFSVECLFASLAV